MKRLPGDPPVELVHGAEGMQVAPGSDKALALLLRALGRADQPLAAAQRPPRFWSPNRTWPNASAVR